MAADLGEATRTAFDDSALQRLGIRIPIIQAPMASASSPGMVIRVSNAGGLGSLGAAYLRPERIQAAIRAIRAGTDQSFAVNLFVPDQTVFSEVELAAANRALQPVRDALGLSTPETPPAPPDMFSEQVDVIVEERVPVFSFHLGVPSSEAMGRLKDAGIVVIGSATSAADAEAVAAAGADYVVAQGAEAGGHQGTFDVADDPPMTGLMALLPQVVDAVTVPVIAAGGIMDGRGIAAALCLGACAAQMGTAFLAGPESAAHPSQKQILTNATSDTTRLTRAFSGRPARGIGNDFMDIVDGPEGAILPFPHQNALTRDIRDAAAEQDRPEYLSMWAGQGVALARDLPAAELVTTLVRELEEAFAATLHSGGRL